MAGRNAFSAPHLAGEDVVLFSKPGLAWVQLVWLLYLAMQRGTQSEVNISGTLGLWVFNSC